MVKNCVLLSLLLFGTVVLLMSPSAAMAKSRILYVDSYHAAYAWSTGITEGIKSVLKGKNVELKIFRMDTKRNTSEAYKRKAALEAKAIIESFHPNVVIASDDNASKYLIMPYYKNASLPFVFCGVNYNGKAYGYPYKNVTGMIEVSPMTKLIYSLKHFNRAEKVALLIGNSLTDHKDAASYARIIKLPFDTYYVDDFDQWKNKYIQIQREYDLLLVGNIASIKNWDNQAAENVVLTQTKIPSGCDLDFVAPFAFLGYTKVAQEQGRWAAHAALKILNGTPPSSIPMTQNREGNLIINMKVAKAAGIKVPKGFLRTANRIIK
jgi:ABC-type uncharacterized transport system substrate-binding protein